MSIVMLTMSLARSFFNILRQEQDFMQIGKMINRISNRLRRRSAEVQKSVGISGAQGNILDYILVESENHSVYQKEIEHEFGLRPSTATEALKNLENHGLIKRVSEEHDSRYKKIIFTDKAEEIHQKLRSQITTSEEILIEGISEQDLEIFMKVAGKMLENLDNA
jgi:DNA-binding MarR family transcriptional regulator